MLKVPHPVSHSGKNPEQASPSSDQSDLQLPEGFIVGGAIGGGDCFFDSVAQGLKQLNPEINFTVKSLREVCREQALSSQEMKEKVLTDARSSCDHTIVPPQSGINDDELWKTYLIGIEYTAKNMEKMRGKSPCLYQALTGLKYGNTLRAPIQGRPDIEGRMICSEYNVKLHVIESNPLHATDEQQDPFLHQLIDSSGSINAGGYNKIDYNDGSVFHIINKGGSHFEPILRNTAKETHEKFTNVIENRSLPGKEKIEKLKVFFKAYPRVDVNFRVNQRDDTLLHIAVHNGELKIIKFLLKARAHVNISNKNGKTPIDIAKDNNRRDIVRVLQPLVSYEEVDVPGDGSCLFWSVALAYLTPVKFDDYIFRKRFKKLFGDGYDVQTVQKLIQDNADIYKDNTLRKLVTKVFRSEVVDTMYSNREVLKDKIHMIDFLESCSGSYFTRGIFKKKFESKFSIKKVKQYNVDTSRFQPNFFDEDAVKEICTELGKIQKRGQVQQFIFETYLECMGIPEAWGGEHEINTISKLLETTIIVSQKGSKDYIYNKEKKYCSKIYLSYQGMQHYQFYQVKYSNLMKFVLNFVQLFETKLVIYDVLGNILRQEKRMFPQEININKFVLSIFGFPAYTGRRIMFDVRASLKIGNVTKAVKGFVSLSDLIETLNKYNLGFRKILVEAGCNIFQSFEMQFDEIGFNQVSKVVDDIIDKIIGYYIQKEYERRLDNIGIAEALVFGKYLQGVPDRIVHYGEKSYSLRDLYENIGVAREEKDSFTYYRRSNEDSQYGCRRFLMGEKLEATYIKTETTNVKFENYVYTLDPQNFKNTVDQVFHVVNQEVQAPSAKIIEGFIVKIKSHIEREVSFLNNYISPYHQERKKSFSAHMQSFKETANTSENDKATDSRRRWDRAKKNSKVISLMEENLKKIPNLHYYLKVKETFVSHADTVSQNYSNLFELQCANTAKPKSLWSRVKAPSVKAVASLLGRMNFKDVCAPVEEFTGRQEQIDEVYKKLQEGTAVIIGPSGIGKTQLARKYVDANKEGYLHAYEVNAQDMLSIESSFTSFVRDELSISMEEEGDKGRKKYLFLFQGAKKEDVEKILKIKGQRGGFDCLFTSLDQDYKNIAEVALDNLEEKQAEQLVKKILEIKDKSQDEQVEALVRKLKGFPLAIKQAAACIKNRKLSALGEAFGIFKYLIRYEYFDRILSRNTWQNECDRVLQITSLISTKAIQEVNSKKEVLEILSTMAYLGPGQIDPALFLSYNQDTDELYSIFELLEQYSIVHGEEGDEYKVYVMHELVKKAIQSQFSIDKEKQVLSHAINLIPEIEEGFYLDVGHSLSLFYHSQGYKSLVKESCCLAHMILTALDIMCEYKKALAFGLEALKVLITTNEDTAMVRYSIACTMVVLGEYDLALEIFLNLKREEASKGMFSPLSLDKGIIFIYFKQKYYKEALSYIRSDNFLLVKPLDGNDQCYLNDYLSIVNTVAKIFIMQGIYTDALTVLHYEKELRDEVFLKRSDFDFCDDHYLYPSDMYELYNLETKYTYALVFFFISQDRKKITIEEEMLPHKKNLPRELSISILFRQLQDILKNQEGSQYLQPSPYSVERKIRKALQRKSREETLQHFETVLQLHKDYGFSESHPRVLSVKFYMILLHGYLYQIPLLGVQIGDIAELFNCGVGKRSNKFAQSALKQSNSIVYLIAQNVLFYI